MTALTSTNGVTPTSNGNPAEWFYAYCLPSGGGLTDTLHVTLNVTNTNSTTPDTYAIAFNVTGGLASDVTGPAGFSLADDGVPVGKDVGLSIPSGSLADGTYSANVQIDADPNNKIQPGHTTVHIQVTVGAGCGSGVPSCFFTDSDYNLLKDCAGEDVNANSGGTFQIVTNGRKITATNPGQFYYNMIWTNPGASQDVVINLTSTNLNSTGANAVHAYVFDSSGFIANLTAWELVNHDGTPCGPSGPCTITVPSGKTLWVTWHVEYKKIGQPPTGLSSDCGTSTETITASCVLTDPDNHTPLASCTASATGYLKK